MKIFRFLLAPILGIVVFMFTVGAIERIGAAVYPPPSELNTLSIELADAISSQDQDALAEVQTKLADAMSAYMKSAPIGALLFVVFAWVAAAFAGGLVAAAVAPVLKAPMAIFIGLLDVMGIMMVSLQFKHPVWMPIVGMIGALVVSLLAGWMVTRRVAVETTVDG